MGRYNTQTLGTFAKLSAQSYRSSVSVGARVSQTDYHVIAKQYDSSTGFGAQASYNAATNTLAIAFAGTDPRSLADLLTDAQLAFNGGVTMQDPLARSFTQHAIQTQRMLAINNSVNGYVPAPPSIVFTGHSLGGELAQVQFVEHPGSSAVVFNSPGVFGQAGNVRDFAGSKTSGTANVTYVYSQYWGPFASLIHDAGQRLSDNVVIVPGSWGHLLDNLTNAMTHPPSYFGIRTVSSARLDGQRGLVRAGNEMNALDVIAAVNNHPGGGSITPPPPGGYNFPDPLGGHGPSFSPSRPGPGPVPTPMNLSSHPLSTPKAGGFTVTSHTGYSSRGPYALEGGGATSPAASLIPGPTFSTGPNGITPSLPGAPISYSSPIFKPYHSTSHYASIGSGGMVTGLPVVLDLNGNGVEISLSYKAAFDCNGNGFRQPTAWVAPGDGFLVIDLNADGTRGADDGKIDQAKELVLSMWGPAGSTDLQAVYKRNYGVPMAA